ncbi:MAG: hypothetical protein ACQ9IQ_09645, partial [Nitrospirales bacterium]
MSGLLPNDIIGNIQDITAIVTTMAHPNDLTVAMGGRIRDHEAISEGRVVEEMIVIVEDAGRKCVECSILNSYRFKKNLATL